MKFRVPFFKKVVTVATSKEFELIARIGALTSSIMRLRKDRDEWKAKFEEMEKRWVEAKNRKDELKKEKHELEAKLSDVLNAQGCDTTGLNSSTTA